MISNPASFFINGYEEKEFIYEGGTTLYHFSPIANKLSEHMDCNIIFFANDEKHALDVLQRMFKFALECISQYEQNKDATDRSVHRKDKFQKFLKASEANKIKVSLAPTNQFFKVGWADNDTLY